MTSLKVRNLGVRRGEDLLFSNLSFEIQRGTALVVTGRNGTGKSTLIRVIAGLLAPEAGEVILSIDGRQQPRAAEGCHYLGHRNGMKREMTVEENLLFWQRFMGDFEGGSGIAPEDAAEAVGLPSLLHLPFGYLSAGQQRRIAMARLLVAWRPVWLLDEPTAALDVQSEMLFARLMKAYLEKGGMIMAATHQDLGLETAERLEMKGFEYGEMAG